MTQEKTPSTQAWVTKPHWDWRATVIPKMGPCHRQRAQLHSDLPTPTRKHRQPTEPQRPSRSFRLPSTRGTMYSVPRAHGQETQPSRVSVPPRNGPCAQTCAEARTHTPHTGLSFTSQAGKKPTPCIPSVKLMTGRTGWKDAAEGRGRPSAFLGRHWPLLPAWGIAPGPRQLPEQVSHSVLHAGPATGSSFSNPRIKERRIVQKRQALWSSLTHPLATPSSAEDKE